MQNSNICRKNWLEIIQRTDSRRYKSFKWKPVNSENLMNWERENKYTWYMIPNTLSSRWNFDKAEWRTFAKCSTSAYDWRFTDDIPPPALRGLSREMFKRVENVDFEMSSMEASPLLRKLGCGNRSAAIDSSMSPNAMASHIVKASRAPQNAAHTTGIKCQLKDLPYSQLVSAEDADIAC